VYFFLKKGQFFVSIKNLPAAHAGRAHRPTLRLGWPIMPDSKLDIAGLTAQLETGDAAARGAALDVLEAAQTHVSAADALALGGGARRRRRHRSRRADKVKSTGLTQNSQVDPAF
jgi:hypothetical protein